MNKRLPDQILILDSLRAFAALSVCLFHFVCTTTGFVSNKFILEFFSFGKYGVQMFFVISGFIIPWSMYRSRYKFKNFFNFFLKRMVRLEPPYLFSLMIAILLLLVRHKFYNTSNVDFHIDLIQIGLHIGYLIPFFDHFSWLNQVYWTLAVEFQYYFFIALFFVPLVKSSLFLRMLFYFFSIAISFITDHKFLFYWLPVFSIGILLFLKTSGLILNKEFYIVLIMYFSFSLFKYQVGIFIYEFLTVFAILWLKNIKITFFSQIGEISYSIYLIHPLIGATCINVLSHYCHNVILKIVVIIVGFLITLISAKITYILIEKPSKKLSSGIKYSNIAQ